MKPLRSKLYPRGLLLNPETPYVPAAGHQTSEHLRAVFDRERERLRRESERQNVYPIRQRNE